MALISCPECNAKVSESANKCPKCAFQIRKSERTFFGKLVKWSFIGFNVLMLIWMISGVDGSSHAVQSASSNAEKVGAEIGTGIGVMLLLMIWVFGDIILGLMVLFTKPKK